MILARTVSIVRNREPEAVGEHPVVTQEGCDPPGITAEER
jgi:hypothetical protein